jgi:hypothetical protein
VDDHEEQLAKAEMLLREVGEAAAGLYFNRLPLVIEAKKQDAMIAKLQRLVYGRVWG